MYVIGVEQKKFVYKDWIYIKTEYIYNKYISNVLSNVQVKNMYHRKSDIMNTENWNAINLNTYLY
jgi:hypothetical protein